MYIVKWAASWLLNVYLADFSEILKAACMRWATQPCRKFSKVISIGFVHSTNCISGWFLGFFYSNMYAVGDTTPFGLTLGSASVNWLVPQLWAGMYVVHIWHMYTCDMGCIHMCVMNAFVNWIVPLLWAGMYVVVTRHTYTSDMGCIHMGCIHMGCIHMCVL